MRAAARAGLAGAAVLWLLLGLRWFDVAEQWRPAWLEHVPAAALALATVALGGWWLRARRRAPAGPSLAAPPGGLLLAAGLAVVFRLPLAWQGAAAYVTPDGALSGIVALHLRGATERLVFVPQVPYSGSLKSHLTAPLAAVVDPSHSTTTRLLA